VRKLLRRRRQWLPLRRLAALHRLVQRSNPAVGAEHASAQSAKARMRND
jgi:hypothetical protein